MSATAAESTLTGMNFEYSENQKMIAQTIRDFAEREIRPNLMKWDEEQIFPRDLFHKMGELGFLGVYVPEKYNGAGFGYFEYVTVVSEIAKKRGQIKKIILDQGVVSGIGNIYADEALWWAKIHPKRLQSPKLKLKNINS